MCAIDTHTHTHSESQDHANSQTLCKPFIFLPCFGLLFVFSFSLHYPASSLVLFNYAARMKRRDSKKKKEKQGRRSNEMLAKVCYIFNGRLKIRSLVRLETSDFSRLSNANKKYFPKYMEAFCEKGIIMYLIGFKLFVKEYLIYEMKQSIYNNKTRWNNIKN